MEIKRYFYVIIPILSMLILLNLCSEKKDPLNPYSTNYDPEKWMPQNLQIEEKNIHTIALTWEQVEENIDGFMIDKKVGGHDIQNGIDTLDRREKSFNDTSAVPTKKNIYWVYAYADENKSKAISEEITIEFPHPTDLDAKQESLTEIKLSWKDNCDGETGYRIDRKTENNEWEVSLFDLSSNEFMDTSVTPGNQYSYRVYAYQDEYFSEKVDTNITAGFPAPTNLQIEELSISEVRLRWQDNSNGEDGFIIDKKVGTDQWQESYYTIEENIESWTDDSAIPKSDNYYRIYAYKDDNFSDMVETSHFIDFPPPSNLTIEQESDVEITLNWNDNSKGEQGFKIDRKTGSDNWLAEYDSVSENINQWSDTNPVYGVENQYRIYAYTDKTNTDLLKISINNIIQKPTNLLVSAIDNQKIEISWNDNCLFENGYKIEKKISSGSFTEIADLDSNSIEYMDNNIEQNKQYTYQICAYTTNNQSEYVISNQISINNNHPIPWFTINPESGNINTEFSFDASPSTDSEDNDSNLLVRWDFENDGAWDTGYSTTKTAKNNYSNIGSYTIKLEVKDSGNLKNDTTRVITVNNTSPTASFNVSPESGSIGTEFQFDASECRDIEDNNSDLLVRWDFGEGNGWTSFTTEKATTHQYLSSGTYAVKLEAKDTEGAVDDTTISVNVGNTSPNALFTISPGSGTINTEFTFDASGCSDSEDNNSDLQVRWDWENDNSWDTGYSTNKTSTHQYSLFGDYEIKMEVKDTEGAVDDTVKSLRVLNQPPTIESLNQSTSDLTAIITAKASDPDNNLSQVEIDWDDGNTTTITSGFDDIQESYTYSSSNTYTVYVTATDDKGASNSKELNVLVLDSDSLDIGKMIEVASGQTSSENGNISLEYDIIMGKYEITHSEFIEFLNDKGISSDGYFNGRKLVQINNNACAIQHDGSAFYFAGSYYAKDELCPVICVTWYGMITYCNWLSNKNYLTSAYNLNNWELKDTNREQLEGYRIPSNIEWEYTARGGKNGNATEYSGSNNIDLVAWYDGNSADDSDYRTHLVGQKYPNELGIYDMSGNVWEWTDPSPNSDFVVYGGSFNDASSHSKVNYSTGYTPYNNLELAGFRLSRTKNAITNSAPIIESLNHITSDLTATIISQITDPDNNLSQVEIDWDDGNTTTITSGFDNIQESHTYSSANTYIVSVTATDDDGATASQDVSVTVEETEGDMIYVSGGTFTMGDVWGDGWSDETPTHEVTVSSFYMSKYEVTQKQYQEIMGSNPSDFDGENNPVQEVSWYDAIEFCNKLSEQDGLTPCYTIDGENTTCDFSANGYRLPTEAEWEYAARSGGRDDRKYSGTNSVSDLGDYAWYNSETHPVDHPVGTKQPNDLGIYDMSGNIYEWCWDWYGDYSSSSQTDPTGPSSGSHRIFRGGSYGSDAYDSRTARRDYDNPTGGNLLNGFRILRTQ